MSSNLPAPAPALTPETEPYWSAAAENKLVLKKCTSCQVVMWPPRSYCPECASSATEWIDGSGRGAVFAHTVIQKGDGAYRPVGPYVLAYVELEEGPRVLTNVVGVDPADVTIGMRVKATFDPTGEGTALLRFEPA